MFDKAEARQKVIDVLTNSKSPILHTSSIYGKVCGHYTGADGYKYRKLLTLLHDMEVEGELYCFNSPRTGNDWMLKMRDLRVALPVSYESIIRHELPF